MLVLLWEGMTPIQNTRCAVMNLITQGSKIFSPERSSAKSSNKRKVITHPRLDPKSRDGMGLRMGDGISCVSLLLKEVEYDRPSLLIL